MQLLVIGAENQIGKVFTLLHKEEGLDIMALETDPNGYLSPQIVKSYLLQKHTDFVINTSLYPNYFESELHSELVNRVNFELLRDLAELCNLAHVPFFQISGPCVFDGKKEGAYNESDLPAPQSVYGKALLKGEQAIQACCPEHVILRTGMLFSQWGQNCLTQILEKASEPEALVVPDGLKGCPTSAADVVRVTIAMLKQLKCSSNTWGTFHYCSSDATTAYDFADMVLSLLSQHIGSIEKEIMSSYYEDNPALALHPINSVMSCRKILNAYGIKQRSWRTGLAAIINEIYPELPDAE